MEAPDSTMALIYFMAARELWSIVKVAIFKKDDILKANTEATLLNTAEIKAIREDIVNFSHIPADVNEAHTKIRVIEERLKNLEN